MKCIIVSLVGIWPTELDQKQTIQTDPIVDSGRKVARVCKSSHFLAYQHKHDAELLVPDDDFISKRWECPVYFFKGLYIMLYDLGKGKMEVPLWPGQCGLSSAVYVARNV